MEALEKLKKRCNELITEKAKRLERAEKDIKETAEKAAAIEKKAKEAHAARDYDKQIELNNQADKFHKIEAEYIKERDAISGGVLVSDKEYKSAAEEVKKELQELTAANYKKICKLITELKEINNTERDTLDEANSILHTWQYNINGRRDLVVNESGIINPFTELRYKDYSNVQYLTYILETMDATADFMKRYESK